MSERAPVMRVTNSGSDWAVPAFACSQDDEPLVEMYRDQWEKETGNSAPVGKSLDWWQDEMRRRNDGLVAWLMWQVGDE